MKKIFCVALALIVAVTSTVTAYAYSVGDNIQFNAGTVSSSISGNQNSNGSRKEWLSQDSVNRSNVNAIESKFNTYVRSIDNSVLQKYTQFSDRIVITRPLNFTKNDLMTFVNIGNNFQYGGNYNYSYYDIHTNKSERAENRGVVLDNTQMGSVIGIAGEYGYTDVCNNGIAMPVITWNTTPSFDLAAYDSLLNNNMSLFADMETVRPSIQNNLGIGITDFDNYFERYKGIEAYLSAFSAGDMIRTEHIVEIKVEDVTRGALWYSQPKTWGSTGQTHYWQFQCISSIDGQYHASTERFGGQDITQMFAYPGQYRVRATQIMEQEIADIMSYSVNEYWVLADTGQVIYKKEMVGDPLPSADNDTPVSELNLDNVKNYKRIEFDDKYITVYDSTITVNNYNWTGSLQAPSVWGNGFQTQRIE